MKARPYLFIVAEPKTKMYRKKKAKRTLVQYALQAYWKYFKIKYKRKFPPSPGCETAENSLLDSLLVCNVQKLRAINKINNFSFRKRLNRADLRFSGLSPQIVC